MGARSAGLRVLLAFLTISTLQGALPRARFRRTVDAPGTTELTVTWEGITADDDIVGFIVEYRRENDTEWQLHEGIIPYEGPNNKYIARISHLPEGVGYLARVKLLGKNGLIVKDTPEIRAKNETATFNCGAHGVSAPQNVRVTEAAKYSLLVTWDSPECGSASEYVVEVSGSGDASFDIHKHVVTQHLVSVTSLLPGTEYNIRVRAADRSRKAGPWSDTFVAKTNGNFPRTLSTITLDYRTDSKLRISWPPSEDPGLQHYDTIASGHANARAHVHRARVGPSVNSEVFSGLSPDTEYSIGVVAYSDHEPRTVYKLRALTASNGGMLWENSLGVSRKDNSRFVVSWKNPAISHSIKYYIVEYRLPNEKAWRKYSSKVNNANEFSEVFDGFDERLFYWVRVLAVDNHHRVVLKTPEIRIGSAAKSSCSGDAGIPRNIRQEPFSDDSVKFSWDKPRCDESLGPIAGYEYQFWDGRSDGDNEKVQYVERTAAVQNGLQPGSQYAFRVRSQTSTNRSPWSSIAYASPQRSSGNGNAYQLRLVSTDHNSYLVWRPLPADRNRVSNFKLSYKKVKSDDVTNVVNEPEAFKCPEGLYVSPGEYCYDLARLDHGVRYTANVVYETDSARWSAQGEPLYFILATQGDQTVPSAPYNLQISPADASSVELRWLPPFSAVRINFYQIMATDIHTGLTKTENVSGSQFSHVVSRLSPHSYYNISVRAGTETNELSPAEWKVVSPLQLSTDKNTAVNVRKAGAQFADPDVVRYGGVPVIEGLEVEQRGSRTTVKWSVGGDQSQISGYKVEVRLNQDRDWSDVGGLIPHDSLQLSYTAPVSNLKFGQNYNIRVSAFDESRNVIATSEPKSFLAGCQAPTAAPGDVRIEDSGDGVRVHWAFSVLDAPECSPRFNIIGYKNGSPFSKMVDSRAREYRFSQSSDGDWRLQVQAENLAGVGPASDSAVLRKTSEEFAVNVGVRAQRSVCDPSIDFFCRFPSSGENPSPPKALVSPPRVNIIGESVDIEWTSEGDGRDVYAYRVQYRTDDYGWKSHGTYAHYIGDGKVYKQTLHGLQPGTTYYVHIQAIDTNQNVRSTSNEVKVVMTCSTPTQPPSNLQVKAADSLNVRVSWIPPPRSTWLCSDVNTEIEVQEPNGWDVVSVSSRQNEHLFKSAPNQRWEVRVRTRNSAGHSAWTASSSTLTPSAGALIDTPNVIYRQGLPTVTWKSKEGVEDLVKSYRLEWRSSKNPSWIQHQNPIPHSTVERRYSVDLRHLPAGDTHEVRVNAYDALGKLTFTSTSVYVNVPVKCQPPSRPPSQINAVSLGSTQIQLSWLPLQEGEKNCDRVWYIIDYRSQQSAGRLNISMEQNQYVFESTPSASWTFLIQAANIAGESPWSEPMTVQTQGAAPGPVSDLAVQSRMSDVAYLRWMPPQNLNGVAGYEITYQLMNRGMCGQKAEPPNQATSSRPSYEMRGLMPNSLYRVSVAAKTAFKGETMWQELQTDEAAPSGSPQFVRALGPQATEAQLTWQPPNCLETNGRITDYEYEVKTDGSTHVREFTNGKTVVKVVGLTPFTPYTVAVRGYTSKGYGPWSESVHFRTAPAPQISPPSVVKVISTGSDNAHLVWQEQKQSQIDKYKCRYSEAGRNDYKEQRFPAHSPCAQDVTRSLPSGSKYHCGKITGLQENKEYEFQVHACSAENQCSRPTTTKCTVGQDMKTYVTRLSLISKTATSLDIEWDTQPQFSHRTTGFRITVKPVERYAEQRTVDVGRDSRQHRIDGLEPSTNYKVTVEVLENMQASGGRSEQFQTKTKQALRLTTAPTVQSVEAKSVRLVWPAPAGEFRSFIVQYRLENGQWRNYYKQIPMSLTRRQSYDTEIDQLETNKEYSFRIRIVSLDGEESEPSPEASTRTTCSLPNTPVGVTVDSPSPTEIRVRWSRPDLGSWECGELNYEISFTTRGTQKVTAQRGQTQHRFQVDPNTHAVIKCRAVNTAGVSPWSEEQSVTTGQGNPGPVTHLQLTAVGPNEVLCQWAPPVGNKGAILGYDIKYRLKHRVACPSEQPRDLSTDFIPIYNTLSNSYRLTGLTAYSLYEVQVFAKTTVVGPGVTGEVTTDQQPPSGPPLELEYLTPAARSVTFQWEPVECSQRNGHIISYEYEILGIDDWAKLEKQIANTTELSITINDLTPYTKYVMHVKAFNSVGGGPNTAARYVTTHKADAPLAPQEVSPADVGIDAISVSWLPPYPPYGPHDSYKIQWRRNTTTTTEQWQEIVRYANEPSLSCDIGQARLCHKIPNLESGEQYFIRVAVHIEGGSYGPYKGCLANTLEVLPKAPQYIRLIEATDHSLLIRWVAPEDPKNKILKYQLHVIRVGGNENEKIEFLVEKKEDLTHFIDNLEPETAYNISIAAMTTKGYGPPQSAIFSTNIYQVPALTKAPDVTPDGGYALDVRWNGLTDPKNRLRGYVVEFRPSDNSQFEESVEVPHDPRKKNYDIKLENLDADTLYIVRVKVIDKKGRAGKESPEANQRTGCAAPSSPPDGVSGYTPSPYQFILNWKAPGKTSWHCSEIGYEIEYRNGTQPVQFKKLPSSATEQSFESLPYTPWVVRIRLVNSAGTSKWSAPIELKTPEGAPGPVVITGISPLGMNQTKVGWEEPKEPNGVITGYTVEYALDSLNECGPRTSELIKKDAKDLSYIINDLLPAATYSMYVTAHTAAIPGGKSEVFHYSTEEAPPTGAPVNLRVGSVRPTKADLSWSAPACESRNGRITGYSYELETLEEWGNNAGDETVEEKTSFENLVPFTRYRARVKANNKAGEGPWSEWFEFRTLSSAPPAPTDLVEEQSFPHAIEISFLPPFPPNGVVDEYKIRHKIPGELHSKEKRVRKGELQCSDSNKQGRLCYRVGELGPEQEYEIDISGHTVDGGWSSWSDPLTAKTHKQKIPVLEQPLQVTDTKPTTITVEWDGLDSENAAHVIGYVLEYKAKDADTWQEYNGIVKHKQRPNVYTVQVKNLDEATEYFFRLKVVGVNDKRGAPGPEANGKTKCGKPQGAPYNLRLEAVGFDAVKLTWTSPERETWKCDNVEYELFYDNTTSQGTKIVPSDSPNELTMTTLPGAKWKVKMRTQTVEEGEKVQNSQWSPQEELSIPAYPGEIFVEVEVESPTSATVVWRDPEGKWNHGVDVVNVLKKMGSCNTTDAKPLTKQNVRDKRIRLDNLKPGTLYQVTVAPYRSAASSGDIPKTVREYRTKGDVPSGPPTSVRILEQKETSVQLAWEPPVCEEQNGEITQYEYQVSGADAWNAKTLQAVTQRRVVDVYKLLPGAWYYANVSAYTADGAGPWSERIKFRTLGTEIGPPREPVAIQVGTRFVYLTWLPPDPVRAPVVGYQVIYSPHNDDSNPVKVDFAGDKLSCSGLSSLYIHENSLCAKIDSLEPDSTYRFTIKGISSSGGLGDPSPEHFVTTMRVENLTASIRLLWAGHDNLKVNWTPPAIIRKAITKYKVNISLATSLDKKPTKAEVGGYTTDYHFHGLEPASNYNITVEGVSPEKIEWFATAIFATTDYAGGLLTWMPAPTNLKLIEKSETMMHLSWDPPEIFDPAYTDTKYHYKVTIAPFDPVSGVTGPLRNFTVPSERTTIQFTDLNPATIYNITVQAGTENGYGPMLWGVYSTLAPGEHHILKLLDRTPTTLTVEWLPVWPTEKDYVLFWKSLHSAFPRVPLKVKHHASVNGLSGNYTITGLHPSTVYNVTLQPADHSKEAWGAYATLPPGWFLVRNLEWCAKEDHAVSLTWDPIPMNLASHYEIRYLHTRQEYNNIPWTRVKETAAAESLCPLDPYVDASCSRRCSLVYNLEDNPSYYVFQVRAKVNGEWNEWKTMGSPSAVPSPGQRPLCCIVPPVGRVDNIGVEGTYMDIDILPVKSFPENVTRYYVSVDERFPPGYANGSKLTDRRTAHDRNYPYYITASFIPETLTEKKTLRIGDGNVVGGYLNYPLQKNKQYGHDIYQFWSLNGKPGVMGRLRQPIGWWRAVPWYYFLLLVLLTLLLLGCLIGLCLYLRYRARKEKSILVDQTTVPLLAHDTSEKNMMKQNMEVLSKRVNEIRETLDQTTIARNAARGDFEDGYVRGFHDANKVGSASAARRLLDERYSTRDDRFHEGYVKGLRDAGMTGMSTSMHNLAQRGQGGGYSSGYMQGFRDGNSGVFGDRISTNLLRRLEEQYPNQEEFRTGYIDGFKEGTSSRTSEHRSFEETRRLQESLTKLTEILQDKSKGGGDEIHTTKIYHVYNQQPEGIGVTYSSTGKHLEHELEELTSSSSRRGTLRRHYTPGDYLKYGSEAEGYGSLGRNRRSLSASALGRETGTEQTRYQSGTGTSYISRSSAADRSATDTFSRRYNYRSRSDMESPHSGRRYASQTLLDAARPGPSTPHVRRDALNTLQRELDTLSRSPDRSTPRGYSSDTGYINESMRSKARGYSNFDYDSYQAGRSEVKTSPQTAASGARSSSRYSTTVPVKSAASSSYSYRKEGGAEASPSSHNWPNDLTDIVNEPMGQTLERMKKYSSSMSQVDRDAAPGAADDGVKESIEERYQRSYKEEYTTGY